MDNRITEFNRSQRIALARVVSDLIMADKIIDDAEVVKFGHLFGKEDNRELFHDAQGLTFAQALKLLTLPEDNIDDSDNIRRLNASTRKKRAEAAAKILLETAESDGFRAPAEALLLLGIDYFLRKNNSEYTKYDIQSFKLTDLFIGKRFILYTDFSNNPVSCKIEEYYDLIVNLLAGIGFQFIYIPKVVEQYKKKGLEMFKAMSMYICPDINDDKVEVVYNKILGMTTKKFIQEYLNGKLGFNVHCPSPALMIMLGRSSRLGKDFTEKGLAYETYANFLKIKIGNDDVLNVISNFVCDFNRLVTFNVNYDFNPGKDKLMYHGIHKAFFRLVALAKDTPNRYNININTSLGAIFINDAKLNLPLGIAAIYALILCHSIFGNKRGLPMMTAYSNLSKTEKDELQKQYEIICGYMQNRCQEHRAPLYPNMKNRISVIKKALRETVAIKFIGEIQLGVGEYVSSQVSPEYITINGIPITENHRWNCLI